MKVYGNTKNSMELRQSVMGPTTVLSVVQKE